MRCLSCGKWSLSVICKVCHKELFIPTISTRKIGTLDVITLFKYQNIEPFLLTKHYPLGYRVFKYFGKQHIALFLRTFAKGLDEPAKVIAIDEQVTSGYSHTALLSHYAKAPNLKVLHNVLVSQNRVNYAGKSLKFRLENPRNFKYSGHSNIDVILIDDIITTGTTLSEAHQILTQSGVNVLFALTIADAR